MTRIRVWGLGFTVYDLKSKVSDFVLLLNAANWKKNMVLHPERALIGFYGVYPGFGLVSRVFCKDFTGMLVQGCVNYDRQGSKD